MRSDDIAIELVDADGCATLINIETPAGTVKLLGELRLDGRTLYIGAAHVEGLTAGAAGRSGINAVLQRILVEADVDRLVIQGATRTTGRYAGRVPSPIVFPR